jgi:hypothetical protein
MRIYWHWGSLFSDSQIWTRDTRTSEVLGKTAKVNRNSEGDGQRYRDREQELKIYIGDHLYKPT